MRAPVLFLFLLFVCSTYAQNIISFNLFPGQEGVTIRFTVRGGTACSGFSILHALDSLGSFVTIGTDYTPCNSFSGNEEKSYTDNSPAFNQMNYYKVQLEPFIETTLPKGVFASSSGSNVNMLVYPDPVYSLNDPATMKFIGVDNVRLVGSLYNQFGHEMYALDFTTYKGTAVLPYIPNNNGVYLLWLTDGYQVFNCKFIVMH